MLDRPYVVARAFAQQRQSFQSIEHVLATLGLNGSFFVLQYFVRSSKHLTKNEGTKNRRLGRLVLLKFTTQLCNLGLELGNLLLSGGQLRGNAGARTA